MNFVGGFRFVRFDDLVDVDLGDLDEGLVVDAGFDFGVVFRLALEGGFFFTSLILVGVAFFFVLVVAVDGLLLGFAFLAEKKLRISIVSCVFKLDLRL